MNTAITLDAKPAGAIPAMNANGAFVGGENLLVALALAAMALLPVAEILLRSVFRVGIPGAATLTQHLVLVAGILGAAIAARQNRLLSLSSLPLILRGWTLPAARALSGCVGALVSALLAVASTQFVITEKLAGNLLIQGLPVWVVQAILPLGFALIAVRLILHAGKGWRIRVNSIHPGVIETDMGVQTFTARATQLGTNDVDGARKTAVARRRAASASPPTR